MASQEIHAISPSNRSLWLSGLLLLAFLLYANTIFGGFVFDDHSQIELNPYVHSFRYIGKLFGTSLLAQQGKQAPPNFYRPLSNVAYLICYKLFGESAAGYHLVCVLLHCVAVWLVFLLGSRLFRDERLGLLAGLVFVLHPVHVEPVAWIDGIGDPLFTVFFLTAFWFYLKLGEESDAPKAALQTGMLLAFTAALFAKEPAVIFPFVATIFEHFYRSDRAATSFLRKLSRYAGLWLALAAYFVLRIAAVGQVIPAQLHSEVTRSEAVYSALALIGQYARKLIWPTPLIAFYPFQKSISLFEPAVLAGIGVLALSVGLFVFLWKHARLYSFTLLWMALAIAPALNTRWMTMSVFAERYLYLPSVAFSWLAAGALLWIWNRAGATANGRKLRWALAAGLALLACLATYATVARTLDWRSDRALVVSTLRALPNSPHSHVQYGIFRWSEGAHAEAEMEWKVALMLNPESVEAMAQLGRAMLEAKQYDQSTQLLQRAITLKPNFATAHVLQGQVYEAEGRDSDAESEFQRAISIHPNDAEAMDALGKLYLKNHRLAEAERAFRASVEVAGAQDTWANLGRIYDQQGEADKAIEAWTHVLEAERFNPEAHRSLGLIYLSRHQWGQAQNEFQMCLLMNPKDATALEGLGKIKAASTAGSNSSANQ